MVALSLADDDSVDDVDDNYAPAHDDAGQLAGCVHPDPPPPRIQPLLLCGKNIIIIVWPPKYLKLSLYRILPPPTL